MELKPYGIFVSVAYPPDTDTPGYELEMQSKPDLTKRISDSGSVFLPEEVAKDMVDKSTVGEWGWPSVVKSGYIRLSFMLILLHCGFVMTHLTCLDGLRVLRHQHGPGRVDAQAAAPRHDPREQLLGGPAAGSLQLAQSGCGSVLSLVVGLYVPGGDGSEGRG